MIWLYKKHEFTIFIAENNSQLKQCIYDYDEAVYEKKRKQFMLKHNVVENGDAAMKVANVVEQWMENRGEF